MTTFKSSISPILLLQSDSDVIDEFFIRAEARFAHYMGTSIDLLSSKLCDRLIASVTSMSSTSAWSMRKVLNEHVGLAM